MLWQAILRISGIPSLLRTKQVQFHGILCSRLFLFNYLIPDDMHAAFFLACCQGSKPVLESFSDIQCVFLEDSRRHCIFL